MYSEGSVANPEDSKTVFLGQVNFELSGFASQQREAAGWGGGHMLL